MTGGFTVIKQGLLVGRDRLETCHVFIVAILATTCLASLNVAAETRPGETRGTLLRSSSCATSTCHGNQSPDSPIWSRSLALYLANDPHASAGVALQRRESQIIVARLDPESVKSRVAYDNFLRTRCIACHVTVESSQCEPIGEIPDELIGQGVSCESCHGPAGGWLDEHVQPNWPRLRDDRQVGFRDNETVLGRAATCVRCHVGSRRDDGLIRDVNHDLIAAGHPVLRFDLLTYNTNLSTHWDMGSEHEKELLSSSIRLREVGQTMGLAAAARLSGERASDYLSAKRAAKVVWPELADFDCFACHQALSSDSYHLPPSGVQRSELHISDGLPVWNAWHSSLLLNLRNKPEWLSALSPQQSNPQRMAEIGPRIAEHFETEAQQAASRTPSPKRVLDETIDDLKVNPPVDWHAAAIQFLRMEAVADDLMRSGRYPLLAKPLTEKLPQLERLLRFNSDAGDDNASVIWMSPKGFRAKRFQTVALESLGLKYEEHDNSENTSTKNVQ